MSASDKAGYVLYEIEINSTASRRSTLVLTVPKECQGPFPAVVVLAGHGGTRHTAYGTTLGYHRIGEIVAQSGYVTVSTSVGQHGVFEEGRTLMGERLWDLMRCIDYLESRDELSGEEDQHQVRAQRLHGLAHAVDHVRVVRTSQHFRRPAIEHSGADLPSTAGRNRTPPGRRSGMAARETVARQKLDGIATDQVIPAAAGPSALPRRRSAGTLKT